MRSMSFTAALVCSDYFLEVEETDGTPSSAAIYSLHFDNDSCAFKGVLFKPGRKKDASSLNSQCEPTSGKSFLEPSARRICAAVKESLVAAEGGKRTESTNATRSGTQ